MHVNILHKAHFFNVDPAQEIPLTCDNTQLTAVQKNAHVQYVSTSDQKRLFMIAPNYESVFILHDSVPSQHGHQFFSLHGWNRDI